VRMAGSRRRERVLAFEARLMARVNCFAPGLLDRLLARMLISRKPASPADR